VILVGTAVPALASVSATPASGTPALYPNGTVEVVRQLVQCGGTMYAVGAFTEIKSHGVVYARNNIFSFSATSPFAVTTWNPNVNGKVNSIAFNGTSCSNAYIGGLFTTVHGTTVKNIAEVSTSTGAVVTGFGHSANGQVQTLRGNNGHILAGGFFTSVNGGTNKYFVSLSPSTGKDDGFLKLNISGTYGSGPTQVYNQQISHGGTLELAEGTFTSVGGASRRQIFMLNLATSPATVTKWTSAEFNQSCVSTEAFYVRAASWSPDDSTVYIGTTGFHLANWNGSFPQTGLCDVAAAFPATTLASVSHKWINYTGCDSLYSTAADSTTAYFGGHERWSQNPSGCDFAGPGAISAPGMEGLSPSTGLLTFNPTRARGAGADDMMITSAGLWIASDNKGGASQCGGVSGHAGICFLPY
jgi:hypothetical protein